MRFWQEKNGVSVIIGTIMIFAILSMLYLSVQVTQVPQWNRQLEFQSFQTAYGDMLSLKADIGQVAIGGMPKSTAVHLGTRYPDRPFFTNGSQGISGALIKEDAPITVQYFYQDITPSPPGGGEPSPGAADQHYLYAFRGGSTTTFWRYTTTEAAWIAMAPAPANVQAGGGLANAGSAIYALAGGSARSFWKYTISSDTWSSLADAPDTIGGGGAILYANSYIYVLRGGTTPTFWRYDIGADSWAARADLPETVSDGGALVYDGTYLYAQVGKGQSNFYRYNITSNNWAQLAPTPGTVKEGGALVYDGTSIWGFGGHNTAKFWKYDIAGGSWTVMADAPSGVDYGGALAYGGGYIYGLQGNSRLGFWRYDITGNMWTALADVPSSISAGGALAFQDTAIGAYRLVFITGSRSIAAGSASAVMTVQTQDADGAPLNVTGDTVVNLSSTSPTGRFDTSASGAFDGAITSVTILSGANTASFYYKDTTEGTPTITATANSGSNVTITDSPTTSVAVWTNPASAYADGGGYASITSGSPSAAQTYGGYGFSLGTATVDSVRVRTDAWSAGGGATRSGNPTDNTNGANPWTNPANGYTQNNSYATVSPTYGGTTSQNPTVNAGGANPWTNPANGYTQDNNYATVSPIYGGTTSQTPTANAGGSNPWTNPANGYTSNNSYATATTTTTTSGNVDPAGDDANTGGFTFTGGASRWQSVSDSSDATYITGVNNGGGYYTSTITNNFAVPTDAKNIILNVVFRFNASSTAANGAAEVKVGGTYYQSSTTATSGTITDVTKQWTTNPGTGAAWTAAEINGTDATNPLQAIGVGGSDFNPDVNFYKVYAYVTYYLAYDQLYGAFGITGTTGTITGVEVGYEAFASATGRLDIYTSNDGGTTWSAAHTTANLGTTDPGAYTYVDVTSDFGWTWTTLNDSNLKVKVATSWVSGTPAWSLDALVVRVTHDDRNARDQLYGAFGITGTTETITGVEVGYEAFASATGKVDIYTSNDGGVTWSAAHTTANLGTTDPNAYTYVDITGDFGWTWTTLNDSNLKVKVATSWVSGTPAWSLDALVVRVTYGGANNEQIRVRVSWDGGTTWSSYDTSATTGTEATYWHDFTGATAWTAAKLTDINFKVSVEALSVGDTGEVRLDWMPVEVSYHESAPVVIIAAQQALIYPPGSAITLTYPSSRLIYEARGAIGGTVTYEHGLIIRRYATGSVTVDSQSLLDEDYIYIPVVDAGEFTPLSSLEAKSVNLKPYPEVSARTKIASVIITLPTAYPEVWQDRLAGFNTASTVATVDANAGTVTITSTASRQITLPAGAVSGEGIYVGMISFSTREEPPIPPGVTIIDTTTDYPRVIDVTITAVGDGDDRKTHSTISATVMNATGPYDIHADLTDLTKNPADFDVLPNYASPDAVTTNTWAVPNNNTVEWQVFTHPEYSPGDAVLVKFWIYNSELNQQYSLITVFERQSTTDWEQIG